MRHHASALPPPSTRPSDVLIHQSTNGRLNLVGIAQIRQAHRQAEFHMVRQIIDVMVLHKHTVKGPLRVSHHNKQKIDAMAK